MTLEVKKNPYFSNFSPVLVKLGPIINGNLKIF